MRPVRHIVVTSTWIWAVDEEGNIWRRGIPGSSQSASPWEFIDGPPDGEPGGDPPAHWVDQFERRLRRERRINNTETDPSG